MATRGNDIEMRITADSRGVAAGLRPMMTSLDQAQAAAEETEAALDAIGTAPIRINVNDAAIENARAEISRLRNQIRQDLSTNVNADTREAERRIKELQRSIRILDRMEPKVEVQVETTRIDHLRTSVVAIHQAISGGGVGGAGLVSGIGAASRGLGALGGAAGAAATPVGAAAAAMVVAGDAAWNLGQMAADAETQVAQLDALTKGMGEETFGQLQEFAAETPFAIDEITAATKKLVAAGVPLEDLPTMIEDLGEVAAATGVPIEQISTVFAQMVSKGKASYEELQQLAEAGVPVWQILADKLGLTTAEVQKLATEGKLSADAIRLLQESLGDTYSGAMARQAETFNGRMSTLRDTITQTGQQLGRVFLPEMKDLLHLFQTIADPALDAAKAIGNFNDTLEERSGLGITGFTALGAALDFVNGGLRDTEEQADDTGAAIEDAFLGGLIDTVQGQIQENLIDPLERAEQQAEDLQQAFEDALEAFAAIGTTIRARVDFIISQDDLEDEIRRITEGSEDENPVQLPAELKLGQIRGLTDAQQELVGTLSDWVQLGLEEGARLAEIDPTFDADKYYRELRAQLRPLAIEAGIDPENVNKFLTNVLGVPAPWKVKPELQDVDISKARITGSFSDDLRQQIGGDETTAPVVPEVDPEALTEVQFTMTQLGVPITKTILIEPQLSDPDGLLSPDAIDRVVNGPAAGGARGGHPTQGLAQPRAAPRQLPVQVLIDGEEIATHLRQRDRQRTTTGGRRNP